MPILRERIAKTTGFQANCGLNALAHVLVKNIGGGKIPRRSLEALCQEFNQYYETNLNTYELVGALHQTNNPVHLEVLLGPVLRRMLVNEQVVDNVVAQDNQINGRGLPGTLLDHTHLMPIANFFGIKVESYTPLTVWAIQILNTEGVLQPTQDQIDERIENLRSGLRSAGRENEDLDWNALPDDAIRLEDRQACQIVRAGGNADPPVLRLRNEGNLHFEYEEESEEAAREHNKAYNNRCDYDAEIVRRRIRDNIGRMSILTNADDLRDINFSNILRECEKRQGARWNDDTDQTDSFGGTFGGMFDQFAGEGFATDIGKKMFEAFTRSFMNDDEPFKPSSDGFMGILEGIMHFALKIAEVFQEVMSVAGTAFAPKQQQANKGSAVDPSLRQRYEEATDALGRGEGMFSSRGMGSSSPFMGPQYLPTHSKQTSTSQRELAVDYGTGNWVSLGDEGGTIDLSRLRPNNSLSEIY